MQPAEHISQTFCLDRFIKGMTTLTNAIIGNNIELKTAQKSMEWIFLELELSKLFQLAPKEKV
jgi:hypothetical protein